MTPQSATARSAAASPEAGPASVPEPRPAYAAGIVNFRSYGDLRVCLASLGSQEHPPQQTLVVDHDADLGELRALGREYPGVHWTSQPNRGFAAGSNAVLSWIERECRHVPFALLLNPDVALAPGYAASLLRALQAAPRAALAGGKLLRPDGRTLDSAGIHMPRHRRPRDRGADQLDRRQYERCEPVFAVTGAALMLRRRALPDLEVDGEIFDEDFFAYHEDTDLAWRARLMHWQVLYVPEARATHRRRWRAGAREHIEPFVRRHSFKNHYLEMVKNERLGDFLRDLPAIALWELLRLGFCLLRDRELLGGYAEAARLLPRAWRKRRVIQRRAAGRRRGERVGLPQRA